MLVNPKKSLLASYCTTPEVFHCPADRSYIDLPNGRARRVRSYSLNSHVAGVLDNSVNGFRLRTRSSFARNGFLFVEEHEDTILGGDFRFDVGINYRPTLYSFSTSLPSARHRGSGSVSFTDGSVILNAWQDPKTLLPILRKEQTGSSSPNSPDVEWFAKQNVY